MPHRNESRLDPRAGICMRIEITPRWQNAENVVVETLDLSVSGAACRSPVYLPLKTQVGVVIRLPSRDRGENRTIACEAVVVSIEEVGRAREQWRAGLYFMNLKQEDRESLRRFVFTVLDDWAEREKIGALRR